MPTPRPPLVSLAQGALPHLPLDATDASWVASSVLSDNAGRVQGDSSTSEVSPGSAVSPGNYGVPVVRALYDLGASPPGVTRIEWDCLLDYHGANAGDDPLAVKDMLCVGSNDGTAWTTIASFAETVIPHGHRVLRGSWAYRYYQLLTWGDDTFDYISDFRVYYADGTDAAYADYTNPQYAGGPGFSASPVRTTAPGGLPEWGVLDAAGAALPGWSASGGVGGLTLTGKPATTGTLRHLALFWTGTADSWGPTLAVSYFDALPSGAFGVGAPPPPRRSVCG